MTIQSQQGLGKEGFSSRKHKMQHCKIWKGAAKKNKDLTGEKYRRWPRVENIEEKFINDLCYEGIRK